MAPPSYMLSVVDRNVVMRRIPALTGTRGLNLWRQYGAPRPAECEELKVRTLHRGCNWWAKHRRNAVLLRLSTGRHRMWGIMQTNRHYMANFRRVRKIVKTTTSFAMSFRPSFRLSGTTRLPLDGLS